MEHVLLAAARGRVRGDGECARDADGRLFIDRSPEGFKLVLEWLRRNCPRGVNQSPPKATSPSSTTAQVTQLQVFKEGVGQRLFDEQMSSGEYTRSDRLTVAGLRCFERFFGPFA